MHFTSVNASNIQVQENLKMLKKIILVYVFSMIVLSTKSIASDHPQTVRLGGRIIGPGTPVIELIQYAGKPMMRQETGINKNTGDIKEVWYYEYGGKIAMIYISGPKVRKVEFADAKR